jgi:hypothetical protein
METKVSIGGNERTVQEYTAFKAVVAGEIISRAGDKFRQLVEKSVDYDRSYAETHTTKITKSLAIARGWTHSTGGDLPDEAFDNDEQAVHLPSRPTQEQRFAHLFPEGFRLARDEVLKLVALTLADDTALMNADAESYDAVDAHLLAEGKKLLHDARMAEFVKILRTAVEFSKEQLAAVEDDLGELRGLFQTIRQRGEAKQDEAETDERQTEPMVGSVVETPSSPESSTD